jgi:hypothetical protein
MPELLRNGWASADYLRNLAANHSQIKKAAKVSNMAGTQY